MLNLVCCPPSNNSIRQVSDKLENKSLQNERGFPELLGALVSGKGVQKRIHTLYYVLHVKPG